jgi:hypothetical protein
VKCILLAQDRDGRRAVVIAVMNLRFLAPLSSLVYIDVKHCLSRKGTCSSQEEHEKLT